MVARVVVPLVIAALVAPGAGQADGVRPPIRPVAGITVRYFGHCCFQVQSPGGVKVLIDPYETLTDPNGRFVPAGFPVYAFPQTRIDADAILVSHSHTDHNYGGTSDMQERWGRKVPIVTDGDLTMGDVHAVGLAGQHSTRNGNNAIKNVIWSIDVGDFRIVHWGDNAVPSDEQMKLLVNDGIRPLEQVDMLILPIDAGCHLLSYEDVEKIRKAIKPKMLVPMHYVIPALQQGVAGMDLETTDWKALGWGPLRPWLKDRPGVVELRSNELDLSDPKTVPNGDVVVFKWPVEK